MHPTLLILLAACSGGGAAPADKADAKPAHERKLAPDPKPMPGDPKPAEAKPAVNLPPDEPGLGDQYLVILASKLDPAEVTPAVDAVKARAEIASNPRVILSSRFKNLMPCYTVGIADAFADKKTAFALSKQLTAAGIDNYVKNAGAYVGPSPALDAFCAGMSASQTSSASVRPLRTVAGRWWMPTGEDLPNNVRLKAPEAMDDTYAAWIQGLGNPDSAAWSALNVATGELKGCKVDQDAILTLGTPHFGLLQGETRPTEPGCGEGAMYEQLDCPSAEGDWLAVAPGTKPVVYKGSDAPELVAAATTELDGQPAWRAAAVLEGEAPPVKTVKVTRYEGPAGAFFLVEGNAEAGNSVCGGDEVQLRALYTAEGQGLGRRLGGFQEAHFSRLLGVVDVEGDGAPELYVSAFPEVFTLSRTTGEEVFHHEIAYCDCAC